ncbi:MAG: metallophosphoesterase [Clostridia bacterium]|nr:metallophosphoesterase [Clostridia bacterium]
MAVYTISDLHLPLGIDKPMDIFGSAWTNYVDRLRENWLSVIKEDDTVVLGGDFSWATYLEQSVKDFEYLTALPGRKILLKGNHDYWWTTANKLKSFVSEHNWRNIEFLHNNFFTADGIAIAGTRGWLVPQGVMNEENQRLYNRELLRLEASIKSAKKAGCNNIAVFLHYPPLMKDFRRNPMVELLEKEGITRCYYGHLHRNGSQNAFEGVQNGVKYKLCAADYLGFMPILVD